MENVETAREHLNRVPISDSDRRQNETNCPVCLEDLCYGVETNCGHIFCGKYLYIVYHSYVIKDLSSWDHPVNRA